MKLEELKRYLDDNFWWLWCDFRFNFLFKYNYIMEGMVMNPTLVRIIETARQTRKMIKDGCFDSDRERHDVLREDMSYIRQYVLNEGNVSVKWALFWYKRVVRGEYE